jgi:hypothetical protein
VLHFHHLFAKHVAQIVYTRANCRSIRARATV